MYSRIYMNCRSDPVLTPVLEPFTILELVRKLILNPQRSWKIEILTYLLTLRYNRFEALDCLRSVRNRCHLNFGLLSLLCPTGRPKKTLRAGSFVSMSTTWPAYRSLASRQWGRRTSRIARRYNGSSMVLPHIWGPKILPSIFLSNAAKRVSSDLENVHVSKACVSTGAI